jgi:hypothetical protein
MDRAASIRMTEEPETDCARHCTTHQRDELIINRGHQTSSFYWAAEEERKSRHTSSPGKKQPASLTANKHRYSVSKVLAPSRNIYVS